MRSLYEINQEYINAIEQGFVVNEETGEVVFKEELLDNLETEFNAKVDNIACYIKDLESLNDGIKAEKKALDERLKANDNKIDRLKSYLTNAFNLRDMKSMETPRNKISFRNSKSVNVLDESLIDKKYFKEEIKFTLDKKTILNELKDGMNVKGCELLEKQNIQIK